MSSARRLVATAALAITGVLGYALTQTVIGGHHGAAGHKAVAFAPAPPASSLAASSPGPTRVVGGMPEGFSRSLPGAVAAATSYLATLEQSVRDGRWAAVVRALTVAPLTAQARHAQSGVVALARRLFSAPGPAFVRGWRLGYRVDSYTRSNAQVAIWTVGLAVSLAEVTPPSYSTTVCTLRWLGGEWKVSGAQTTFGPTPPTDGHDPVAVATFARAALQFHPYRDVP